MNDGKLGLAAPPVYCTGRSTAQPQWEEGSTTVGRWDVALLYSVRLRPTVTGW